jgi:protein-tyrosine phosphatase
MIINNILIVCTANICRSPMAEGLLKFAAESQQKKLCVQSAGVDALVNKSAAKESVLAMQEIGIDISQHRAQQVTETLVKNADIILAMDNYQKHKISFLFPFAYGKVFLLGRWRDFEIPDPYLQDISFFGDCRQLIQECLDDWQKKIWK